MSDFEQDMQQLIAQPTKMKELLMEWHEHMPHDAERAVHFAIHGKHLDEEMMNEALDTITRYDGVKAPFWTMAEFEEAMSQAGITTSGYKYNNYDLNYLTQMYLADFKSLGQEPAVFIGLAIDRLNDIDDPKASEYAYHDAKKRICKHSK